MQRGCREGADKAQIGCREGVERVQMARGEVQGGRGDSACGPALPRHAAKASRSACTPGHLLGVGVGVGVGVGLGAARGTRALP